MVCNKCVSSHAGIMLQGNLIGGNIICMDKYSSIWLHMFATYPLCWVRFVTSSYVPCWSNRSHMSPCAQDPAFHARPEQRRSEYTKSHKIYSAYHTYCLSIACSTWAQSMPWPTASANPLHGPGPDSGHAASPILIYV